jgi:ribokinase
MTRDKPGACPRRPSRAQGAGVVVVGSSNTDMVVMDKALPLPGQTLTGGVFFTAPGGKGANQAVAAARAAGKGTRVTFIGAVGDDDLGRAALACLEKDGIDCLRVRKIAGAPSGVAFIIVDAKGENIIVVAPGANAGLTPADVERAAADIRRAGCLLAQLETPLATVKRAVEIASGSGVRTILNPAPAPEGPLPGALLRKISILTPNETEFAALTGRSIESREGLDSAARLAGVLREALIVTEGRKGVRVFTRGGETYGVPAFKVKAVDTVAAGDAFSGALAMALTDGCELPEAVRFASAAAAVSVTRRGAQPSLPKRREVLAMLARA